MKGVSNSNFVYEKVQCHHFDIFYAARYRHYRDDPMYRGLKIGNENDPRVCSAACSRIVPPCSLKFIIDSFFEWLTLHPRWKAYPDG